MISLLRRKVPGALLRKLELLLPDWQLYYIGGPETLPPPLTGEEERNVFVSLRDPQPERGAWARQQLIVHNLRLVVYIARKFENTGVGIEDLTSIGTIGLIKAVGTFSPERGIKLATYASRCIENEMLMAIRSNRKTRGDISLNAPIGSDKEGNEIMLHDILGTDADGVPDAVATRIDAGRAIAALNRTLDSRERTVIVMRYGLMDGTVYSQNDIAALLGISRSYVSRIEKKALGKLRKKLDRA